MNIYDENGYLDMKTIIDAPNPFTIVVGARGIGKTYSSLKHLLFDVKRPFILMRTTDVECEICMTNESNPFNAINSDFGTNYHVKRINKFLYGVYDGDKSESVAVVLALTSMQKARSMDLSRYDYVFYDEFIPEKTQKRINGIGEAVLQAYETIARNRELKGRKPLKWVMCANALNINNEILITFKVPSILQKMRIKGNEYYCDTKRGIDIICPLFSPISEMKQDSAVYRINEKFNKMSLGNEFREFYTSNISPKNIKGLKLLYGYGSMYFYKDKSTNEIYVSTFKLSGFNADHFTDTDYEKAQFKLLHHKLVDRYYKGRISFESAEVELDFINLFDLR